MTQRKRRAKPIRIQFASDLHLEFERSPDDRIQVSVAPGTTALVLAGDIHNDIEGMDDFVRGLARQAPVVIVAGNHEYFMQDFEIQRDALATWAASIPDVHFLENRRVEIDGVTFLGATFWSNMDNANPRLMREAVSMMADYQVIADRSHPLRRLSPERTLAEHRRSVRFIEQELRARDPARTVVVTHHAPSLTSSRCKGEDWDLLYGSDYDSLIEDCGPALWIHGHVHETFEYTIGRTTVACNPRGYVHYGENPDFDPTRSIDLAVSSG